MGILSSAQTITRYKVEGKIDGSILETVRGGLIKNAMPEIQDEHEEVMVGWVPFEKPYNPNFEAYPFQYGTDFVFSLRIDKKSVPAKVLAREHALAIEAKKKDTGRDFLSKNEKRELRDVVFQLLLSKAPFVPTIHEVCWSYEDQSLMLFSSAKAAIEIFETMFLKSFDLKPIRLFPYTMAIQTHDADLVGESTDISL